MLRVCGAVLAIACLTPGVTPTAIAQTARTVTAAAPTRQLIVGDTVQLSDTSGSVIDEFGDVVNVYTIDAQRGERIAMIQSGAGGLANVVGPDGREARLTAPHRAFQG